MPEPKFWDEDTSAPTHGPAIADPTGGATVDAPARTAINAILAALRSAGIIAQD
ncbi:hypothetical protein ACTWPB_07595 [Nocardia sp. IBHARD005]|uniref:hypothetical protein n=1 Tax=Nocardia sp. IBHARD005 TaxID=3457765 RepID=UPI0040596A09